MRIYSQSTQGSEPRGSACGLPGMNVVKVRVRGLFSPGPSGSWLPQAKKNPGDNVQSNSLLWKGTGITGGNTQSNWPLGWLCYPAYMLTLAVWPARLTAGVIGKASETKKERRVYTRRRWHPDASFKSSVQRIPLESCSVSGAIEMGCQKSPVPWVPSPGHLDSILLKAPETPTCYPVDSQTSPAA